MTPQSAKSKGRTGQQWIRDKMLEHAPQLEKDDVVSTSMGAGGEDLKLSPAARKVFPVQVESKFRKAIAIFTDYKQAAAHGTHEPLLIIRQNHSKPLAVVDADFFLKLMAENWRLKNGTTN
jgi:hypothetical protein